MMFFSVALFRNFGQSNTTLELLSLTQRNYIGPAESQSSMHFEGTPSTVGRVGLTQIKCGRGPESAIGSIFECPLFLWSFFLGKQKESG